MRELFEIEWNYMRELFEFHSAVRELIEATCANYLNLTAQIQFDTYIQNSHHMLYTYMYNLQIQIIPTAYRFK